MKSKAKIEKQIHKKTSKELVETIIAAKKKKGWQQIAGIISSPRKKQINLNLSEIDEKSKDGEHVLVPGKVLSEGEIKKKIKIVALKFSEKAKEKLLKLKIQTSGMLEEIKKNPEAKRIRVLTK